MGKKEVKLSHAAHIKQRTAGTSNEISFSVLDAAKNRAATGNGKGGTERDPGLKKIALFSIPAGLGWKSRKRKINTPQANDVLTLSSGETVAASPGGSAPTAPLSPVTGPLLGKSGQGTGAGLGAGTGTPVLTRGFGMQDPARAAKPGRLPYASPEDEITRRKTERRQHRAAMVVAGALVAAGLLGGGGIFLYTELTNHQRQVSLLDQAIIRLKEADSTIVSIDKLVGSSEGPTAAALLATTAAHETLNELIAAIPATSETLGEAEGLARQASENMRDSSDKEASEQAILSIQARQEMLEAGTVLLQAALDAERASEYFTQAWDTILRADGLARESADLVVDTTNENVAASRQKSEEALGLFAEALFMLNELEGSPLQPDLQAHRDYVTKRMDSMHHAIASDEAILAQDREGAESQNEAYNLTDEEATQIARNFSGNPLAPIIAAYRTHIADPQSTYAQARHRASTADAFLRDYLGT